ncbi:PIN domain nuclease [Nocardia sp. NPDC048505]|uniref:PIN domain nuclease n=1 Tax=unclassified Nocardia TaxID=2637762 RepID=UPI0033F2F986
MSELFLADTSALVRFFRNQTGPEWNQVFDAGLVGICEPVRQEFLRAVGGRPAFYEAEALLREVFPYFAMRDSAWDDTADLQRLLADQGWHQSAGPVDLLVSVTAVHHKLTVLHADRDFDTIAKVTGQSVERIR